MSINRVVLSGNLTRDVEVRHTASGLPVGSFGIAVNDRRKNQTTGEWEEYPNFIDCTMFGTRAENVARIVGKGSKVAVEGKLRYEQWERDGQRRSKVSVVVDEMEFLSRPNGQEGQGGQNHAQQAQTAPQNANDGVSGVYDEDIPF